MTIRNFSMFDEAHKTLGSLAYWFLLKGNSKVTATLPKVFHQNYGFPHWFINRVFGKVQDGFTRQQTVEPLPDTVVLKYYFTTSGKSLCCPLLRPNEKSSAEGSWAGSRATRESILTSCIQLWVISVKMCVTISSSMECLQSTENQTKEE